MAQQPQADPLSGRLNMSVPLHNLQLDGKSIPILLNYNNGGMKVGDTGGWLGVGWNLAIEGSIQRVVKDFPDDLGKVIFSSTKLCDPQCETVYSLDDSSQKFLGWLKQPQGIIHGIEFEHASTIIENLAGETNESNAWSILDGLRTVDTRPDEFIINFPGISGKFMFDKSGNIQMNSYQDLIIEVKYDALEDSVNNPQYGIAKGQIVGFKITDANGYEYIFDKKVKATKRASRSVDEGTIDKIFQREYDLYENSVTYNSGWNLSRINSPYGQYLEFNYILSTYDGASGTVPSIKPKYGRTFYVGGYTYTSHGIRENIYPNYLSKIEKYNLNSELLQWVTFESSSRQIPEHLLKRSDPNYWTHKVNMKNRQMNAISIYNRTYHINEVEDTVEKKYQFSFGSYSINGILFLSGIQEVNDCNSLPTLNFTYKDHFIQDDGNKARLDMDESDPWGYFNNWRIATGDIDEFADIDGNGYEGIHISSGLKPELFIYPDKTDPKSRFSFVEDQGYVGQVFHLPGSKIIDTDYVAYGSLTVVQYPLGGSTKIVYEPNVYYDAELDSNIYGGGVRVSKIYSSPNRLRELGVNPKSQIIDSIGTELLVTKYSYEENGKSTGIAFNIPQYAYLQNHHYKGAPYNSMLSYQVLLDSLGSSELWPLMTVRTIGNLNEKEGYTLYEKALESSNIENGYTEYNYSFTLNDAGNSDWVTSANNYFRPLWASSENLGFINELNGSKYSFLYVTLPNHEIENGLLSSVKVFGKNNNLLRETNYQYQRLNELYGSQLFGYKLDAFSLSDPDSLPFLSYSKYYYRTNFRSVPKSVVTTTYDLGTTGSSFAASQSFNYNSEKHTYLTSKVTINGAKKQIDTYSYPLDYAIDDTVSIANDTYAIYRLQSQNIKTPLIEHVNYMQLSNGNTKVVAAAYNTYMENGSLALPHESYVLGEIVDSTSFSPTTMDFSGDLKIAFDPLYQKTGRIVEYDNYHPMSTEDNLGTTMGTLLSKNEYRTLATISNAKSSQVIYEGFDHHPMEWTALTVPLFTTGYLGINSFVWTGTPLSRIGYKPGPVTSFEFMAWIKVSTSGELTVNLKNGTNILSTAFKSYNSSTEWQQLVIPLKIANNVDSLDVEISSSTGINIDEIRFKPIDSYVNTFHYDGKGNIIASTDNNGRTTYTNYDQFGRQVSISDHNKDILQVYNYHMYREKDAPLLSADFDISGTQIIGSQITFQTVGLGCIEGVLNFYWTIDGGTEFSGLQSLEHTFDTVGVHNITLRIEHPLQGGVAITKQINIGELSVKPIDPK
jgi:YD repeat-containing protein